MRSLVLLVALTRLAVCQGVLMVHADLAGTSANNSESQLTPSNVTAGKFGKLGSFNCGSGDPIFNQPLYVPASVSGLSYDALIVATLDNNVCAFNANLPGSAAVWTQNVGSPNTSYSTYTGSATLLYSASLGCLATPLYYNSALYTVCGTSSQTWVIHKHSISTGAVVTSNTVTGQVTGSGCSTYGDTTSGGNVVFFPAAEFTRPGLKGANGYVYITAGGIGDTHEGWHGWIFAADQNTLSIAHSFNTTPNDCGGAIWGGEPVIDSSGNLYVTTGNGGTYNVSNGTYTDSILALSSTLSLLGSWTPSNQATLNSDDADTAANRVILIPGTNLLAAVGSKDFNVYLLDAGCLRSGGSGTSCQLQSFQTNSGGTITSTSGSYGALFLNNTLYLPLTAGDLYSFSWGGSTFTTTPAAHQSATYGFPGPAQLSGSCNATSNCVVWTVNTTGTSSSFQNVQSGTLRALGASLTPLWNSDASGHDALGQFVKFAAPTIANGRVYVSTFNTGVAAYGLLPSAQIIGAATVSGAASLQ